MRTAEGPLPALGQGGGMVVGDKHIAAGFQHTVPLVERGREVGDMCDSEGRQHEVAGRIIETGEGRARQQVGFGAGVFRKEAVEHAFRDIKAHQPGGRTVE